jgi:hypothetical protein
MLIKKNGSTRANCEHWIRMQQNKPAQYPKKTRYIAVPGHTSAHKSQDNARQPHQEHSRQSPENPHQRQGLRTKGNPPAPLSMFSSLTLR